MNSEEDSGGTPAQNPSAGLAMLRRHLSEIAELGTDRVWLTEPAREKLDKLTMTAHRAAAQAPPTAPLPLSVTPTPQPESSPAVATTSQEPLASKVEAPAGDKAARLSALKMEAENCQRCRSLGSLRDTMVFAAGSPDAQLMFIGEAPGAEEEAQREPFVGPAGQLLTKIIQTMGLRRESVYISNIVKFRPSNGSADQGTDNRASTAEEMEASLDYVKREIEIVEPKLIVVLGGTAMAGLLGLEDSVGRARGQLHRFEGRSTIVTYHPSYLLRSGELRDKRMVWEDMLFAMEHLGLPISDKQKGFFLK